MYISVIVPTYKPGEYLFDCLNSLKNQTIDQSDYEVLIVLNGCEEPWLEKIRQYISGSGVSIFKLIHTIQPGVSNARNLGLDAAIGDYIMFLDDDDYISPTTLKDLISAIQPQTVAIFRPLAFYEGKDFFSYSRTFEFDKKSKLERVKVNDVRKVFSGPVMKLIPSDIIEDRRYDTRFKNGEDSLFMFLISNKIKGVVFAPESAIYYRRIRENSATTSSVSYRKVAMNSIALIKEYSKIFFRRPFQYNFIFYLTRILGAIKAIIYAKGATY